MAEGESCVGITGCNRYIAGALTGILTGLFNTALGIPSILAGILTQLILYSVNLTILGGKSLKTIDPRENTLFVHMSDNINSIIVGVLIVTIMMHEGRVVVDVSGEEKKKLTISQLLGLFEKASGSEFTNDKVILSK